MPAVWEVLFDLACAVVGVALVLVAVDSAVRTFVLPRAAAVPLTRFVWLGMRYAFDVRARYARSWERRDAIMALYAPLSLLAMPIAWLSLVFAGFVLLFHAVGVEPWGEAMATSGSSLFTLGFDRPTTCAGVALAFVEAGTGLVLLALLIAYLPTIYNSFSKRELSVGKLAVWAGTPPSAVEILVRAHRIHGIEELVEAWREWNGWFASLEETHSSIPALPFLRSPRSDRSWVTAAGAVLDAAAFRLSVLDAPWEPQAGLCIRSGFLSLRSLADSFDLDVDHDPRPTDPISIAREEWDDAVADLAAAGLPLRSDLDAAWRDWAGWRVNYDRALVGLAALVAAPYAPWSSDRSFGSWRSQRARRRRR